MRSAILVSLDRFFHQRSQRAFAVLGSFVHANDVLVEGFQSIRNLLLEHFNSTSLKFCDKTESPKCQKEMRGSTDPIAFAPAQSVAYATGVSLGAHIAWVAVPLVAMAIAGAEQPAQTESRKDVTTTTGTDRRAHTNRLAREKSPYLLQHQHNPVDWYAWGEEAFARARRENKPIFLSIGYSTCHWCHVMERESFESKEVADYLNQHFVSIKVDREERPDVDKIYMTFVQAMTGQGGWPLNVFLAPDLKPFYGGTYLPPENKHGRPGLVQVLQQIVNAWEQPSRVDRPAHQPNHPDQHSPAQRRTGAQSRLRLGSWRLWRRPQIPLSKSSGISAALWCAIPRSGSDPDGAAYL